MSETPTSLSETSTPSAPTGARYANPSSEKVSLPNDAKAGGITIPPSHERVGPSALHDTGRPYLADILSIPAQIIQRMELLPQIRRVDDFILRLVQERNLTDTSESYQSVLKELYKTLNITKLTDPYFALTRLTDGIKIIQRQRELQAQLKAL